MSLSTKIAAGTVAGALTILGGLTAASAMNGDVADATGHVLPLAATSHSADAKADASTKPSTEATETKAAPDSTHKPNPKSAPAGSTHCPKGDEHGAAVSAVAKQDPSSATGDAHGDAVSKVANCNGVAHRETDAKADHSGGTHEPTAPALTGDKQADTHTPSSSNAPGKSDAKGQDTNGSTHEPNTEANSHATTANPGTAHR